MQVLGIDYGTKRIGIASGDTELAMAFPLRTVPNDADAIAAVLRAATDIAAERIVVGIPTRLSGAGSGPAGEIELLAGRFADALADAASVPVVREDERFTSVIADRLRVDATELGAARADFDRDAEAASVMLEGYLQRLSHADLS